MKARIVFAIVLAAAAVLPGFSAEQAVFSEVKGKVEYKAPGGDWKGAKAGDKIEGGYVVSTGFKSSAVLVMGKTTLSLRPVTRLTLEELIRTEAGAKTQLYLLAGRVKADVPPEPGKTTEFKIKSPTATASVRGTGFETDGVNLVVFRGSVDLAAAGGGSRPVAAGEYGFVGEDGDVPPPAALDASGGLARLGDLARGLRDQLPSGGAGNGFGSFVPATPTADLLVVLE